MKLFKSLINIITGYIEQGKSVSSTILLEGLNPSKPYKSNLITLVIIVFLLVILLALLLAPITFVSIVIIFVIFLITARASIIRFLRVIQINNQYVFLEIDKELDYPLGNLGIFSQLNNKQDKVLVIFPNLTKDGDLEYISCWYDLVDVFVYSLEAPVRHENLIIMQQLSPTIQEHLQIEKDISKLEKQEQDLKQLLKLISSSDLYSEQKDIYDRALEQVQKMIDRAIELEKIYIRLVREILIGKELSNFNPNKIIDDYIEIDSQYKKVKEEYQHLKDTANAYTELLQSDQL